MLPGDQYTRGDEEQARDFACPRQFGGSLDALPAAAYPRLQWCEEDLFIRSFPLITENAPEPVSYRSLQMGSENRRRADKLAFCFILDGYPTGRRNLVPIASVAII